MNVWLLVSLAIGLLVNCSFGAPALETETDNSTQVSETLDYRLNTDVEPIDYIVELTPYFTNDTGKIFTFDGSVTINLKATKDNVNSITLHIGDLDMGEITLSSKPIYFPYFQWNVQKVNVVRTEYDSRTNKLTIHLTKPLRKDKSYDLGFKFTGKLRSDMHGFYRSSYKEGDKIKWLASTQFQTVHARHSFPCFDEPRFKATFNIIINRPINFQPSLSNTPLKSSVPFESKFVREEFEKTPKMSTYLVAFIVSEFKCRENSKKTFGVCSRPNAYEQTEYSFDVGQKILAKFDKLFGYKYNTHIGKMHMVAIPDFDAGAMENWGLLTFRETALLYDPKVSNALAQQRVAAVVAHEQTHMWFGNLVTCDWWSNTWLNEGFARFFQYFGTALVEDKWGLEEQFVVEQLQTVFGADSLDDTQALFHEVNTPDEIGDRFGSISYNKGASVIRMFEHILGKEAFIKALQKYLKTNALQTSVPEKLYAAFQREAPEGVNISETMGSWVTQPGYPVIFVNVSEDRKSAELSQRKFLRNSHGHNDNTLWSVPITYATNNYTYFNRTQPVVYLSSDKVQIDIGEANEWIILNVQQTGYYRVNYDDASWSAIAKLLHDSPETVHVQNRAQIVDDALNLARFHQLDYTQALSTIHFLMNEIEYIPWLAAFNNFDFILARFTNEEASIFKNFVLHLLNNVYDHLEFHPHNNDTRLDIYNRNNVLKYACRFGHEQCIKDARAEYDQLLNTTSENKIPVDLRAVVYCSVVSEGADATEWEYLWKKFELENVASEQVTILNALGCTKQANLTSKYLELILSESIRLQDKHSALVSTLTQQENVDLVLDFIIENHEKITKVFESPKEVPSILTSVAAKTTTSEQIAKIRKFASDNNLESNKNLQTSLKNAEFNLKWAEDHVPIIRDYIKKNYPNSASTQAISCIILLGLVIISIFSC